MSRKTQMPSMHFDFYYGAEAEQFAFFRIPQLLIKGRRFKCLSTDTKLLYGLLNEPYGSPGLGRVKIKPPDR